MPTLAELLLQLITDQPLSADEKRAVALHVLRLVRRVREAQRLSDDRRTDFRDNSRKDFRTTAVEAEVAARQRLGGRPTVPDIIARATAPRV